MPPKAKSLTWTWACPACGWRSPKGDEEDLEEAVHPFWFFPVESNAATAAQMEAEVEDLLRRWPQLDQLSLLQSQTAGGQVCGSCGGKECRVAAPPRERKRLRIAYRKALSKAGAVFALIDLMGTMDLEDDDEEPPPKR